MSYFGTYQEQEELTEEQFLNIILNLERCFTENVCRHIKRKNIFVLTDGAFNQSYFVNTTVQDVKEVIGKIDIACVANMDNVANPIIYTLKEATVKDCRGRLRYMPSNTLKFEFQGIAPGKTGEMGVFSGTSFATQNTKYIVDECRKAFETGENVDYERIMSDAFIFPEQDKRFAVKALTDFNPDGMKEHSRHIQEIVSVVFELENSWCVTYVYNDILFLIPMEQKYFKSVFKNREKVNGRRNILPTVVKSHQRIGTKGVDSHLRGTQGFELQGREFGFLVGECCYDTIFPHSNKSKTRLKKMIDNSKKVKVGEKEYLTQEESV